MITACGYVVLSIKQTPARRMLAIPAACALTYFLAALLSPRLYLPQRYTNYSLPILLVTICPAATAAAAGLIPWFGRKRWVIPTVVVSTWALWIALVGSRGSADTGFTTSIDPTNRVYGFLEALPPGSLIAAWPEGIINDVPYVCGRSAFVTSETHQAFHQRYTLEMRRRTNTLIDAYFATTLPPVQKLQDDFGVTHLLVDRQHYQTPPAYFKPFDQKIAHATTTPNYGSQILQLAETATVFEYENYLVLDLTLLPDVPHSSDEVSKPHAVRPSSD